MNGKLTSARFWIVVIMTVATSAAVQVGTSLPTEWWMLFGIAVRDYFGRTDRAGADNGGAK